MSSQFAIGIPEIPAVAPIEVLEFNRQIEEAFGSLPPMWEVGAPAARQAREEGRSIFGPLERSERSEDLVAETDGGPIDIRVIPPAGDSRGMFVHIHGGGFVVGGNHHHDPMLCRLADSTGLTVASVNYRLAPEHTYPAATDDAEAGARWLVEQAPDRFGVEVIAIGGESAGANLAVTTMLRLRDRHGLTPFQVAVLPYGVYDQRMTPSARSFGDRPVIINTPIIEWFRAQYLAGVDLDDPDVSPLFADLDGVPPALFVVGDADPLLDDSLFMAARWKAAGGKAEVDVWPGAIHAFDYFDSDYGLAARERMHAFVNSVLA